ncbi:MAG: cytochrome C [Campylobacterota bacterium]|nr:cytochrome C [Campylobacterota bacterium]
MNKGLKLIATSVIGLSLASTVVSADVTKGQKLYSKKLKKACGVSGAKMAGKHTQDEWETIQEDGKLADEIKKLCPDVKKVKEKFIPHYYDFFYEYASDSGNVPSC